VISRDNLQDLYSLSPMQEGMLFHCMMSPESEAYREQIAYRLQGSFDIARFESSWIELARRYDVLRTVFVHEKATRPLQMVLKAVAVRLHVEDLRALSADAQTTRVAAYRRHVREREFDLARDLPWRVAVLQLANDRFEVVWTFHHIILDGWSVGLLVADLLRIYAGGPGSESAAAVPYGRYIKWLEARDGDADRRFWRERLDGYIGPASIPSSRPGRLPDQYEAAHREFTFSTAETAALARFAREHDLTAGTLAQALWALVLRRYQPRNPDRAGHHDMVFGVVVSGRPPSLPDFERMVGLFVNTVPLRVRMDDDEPLSEFLTRLQADAVAAQAHAYVPLADAQSAPGMIDHIIAYENYPRDARMAASVSEGAFGFRIESVEALEQTPYDLNIIFAPGERLSVTFYFNASRYAVAQIERLFSQLRALAVVAATSPHRRIGDLESLPNIERDLLHSFAGARVDRGGPVTIHETIADWIRKAPDAPAIIEGEDVLTYAQLDTRAAHLSLGLRRLRLAPGARVAVLLERGIDLPVSWLAIMRAGGVYVPIDPVFPDERIALMVEDSASLIVLTSAACRDALQGRLGAAAVYDIQALAEEGASLLPMADAPAQLCAYVIYTSGSTGMPKGVAVGHAGVLNATAYLRQLHPLKRGDRVVFFASPSFDASIWEICGALCHGAALMVADRDTVADPARFGAFLRHHTCTVAVLPPSYVRLLALDDLAALDLLTVAGEAIPPDTAERLSGRVRLANLYGPTEASIWLTTYEVAPGQRFSRSVPIGRPIPNVELLVLDSRGELAPVGAPGELCAAGVCVAIGYLNRAELTAERFPDHPWRSGERIYRTGDVVRWLDDGTLEFLGRIDEQVKVRGHRVEPGEIQARLLTCPGVRQAAVIAEQNDTGDSELIGYVVLDGEARIADARDHLRRNLPDYMVPSRLITLDVLPLTPQGKLDRAALPAHAAGEARPLDAPRDTLETNLVAIWQSVLGVSGVGIHDSFFDLGGHSLTAVRLAARVRKELRQPLELRELFLKPTIAGLAAVLRGTDLVDLEPIRRVPDAADYEVSHAQQRLWLLHHLSGSVAAYNIAGAFAIEGALDTEALERAGAVLIARHEALRTTFLQRDGRARQRVHPVSDLSVVVERAEVSGASDPAAAAMTLFREAQARPFDLERGPLVRMLLVTEAPSRHLFVVVLHHIAADGWSVQVMIRDLSQAYAATVAGHGDTLAPLAVHYRDVTAWLNARALTEHRAYWLRQLGGTLPVLDLPTDKPRPPQRSFRGATLSFGVPSATLRRLSALTRAANATLFMALVAAVKVLLARYSGEQEIIVGYPAAGRDHPDLHGQVGFFVNTVALRDQVRPEQSFSSLLAAVSQTVLAGLEHQAYPFDQLAQELGIGRDPSRHPIFDVMVAYERSSGDGLNLTGMAVRPITTASGTSKFDLVFGFNEDGASLQAAIEYSTDLFEPETIARMRGHLLTLLAALADAPDAAIASLALLTEEEQRATQSDRVIGPDLEPSDSIVSRFERTVRNSPKSVAVVCGGEQLTYAELDARASALARALVIAGAGRDLPVGLLIDRSADMLVGMIGILKAGSAYLPLDPVLPQSRLKAMIADSSAPIIVSHSRLAPLASGLDAPAVWVDKLSDPSPGAQSAKVSGRDLAYVIYTSGSTGLPNGVLVEHRNVLALLDAFVHLAPSGGELASTMLCPFGFDVSVWEAFSCLCAGGTLHILTIDIAADAAKLVSYFRDHRITSAYLPPALIDPVASELANATCASLDRLLVGVEPIRQRSLDRLRGAVPGLQIVNGYGPTEATVCATLLLFQGSTAPDEPTPIGRAARGYVVHLLDSAMQPVPPGMPGEIYIGGAGLARGYAGKAVLTAQRFLPDPFASESGARLYRTGDLGRLRPDTTIHFLGRVDQQIKVRGFRIEPGEIEATLRLHGSVRDAAVIARDAASGGKQLVAYLTGELSDLDVASIRDFLKKRLPDYMVPAAFVTLAQLPRTPNGKVDREALPAAPPIAASRRDAGSVSSTEAVLQRLWSDVLGVDGVGCEDDFFDLGGHSLLATRLLGRIREAFGVELPLRALFDGPTVRAAAVRVDAMDRDSAQLVSRKPIRRVERGPAMPLSFAQQRLWFLDRLEPGPAYNVPIGLALEGTLDAGRLERALNAVVKRHESLRTRFVEIDGSPAQDVLAERLISLPFHDLPNRARATVDHVVSRWAASLASKPFDLGVDALMRAVLLRIAPEQHILLLSIHHIVVDGWSIGVLMKEIVAGYVGDPLPELPIQYADYVAWQRDPGHERALAVQLDYWRAQLANLPPLLALPTDRPRTSDRVRTAALDRFLLDSATTSAIHQLGRLVNATTFMVVLAALDVVLARFSGQLDIAIGTPIANRSRLEIEPLIGFFANTVVIRASLEGDPSFADIVGRVREAALGAYAHQDVPFEQVVEALQPQRSLSHTPLFQVMLVLENAPLEPVVLPGIKVRALEQPATRAKFDLTVALEERDGTLAGAVEYDADLFDAGTIHTFVEAFQTLLAAAVAQPDAAVSRLPLLPSTKRRAMLARETGRPPATTATMTVTALVAAQIARTPQAVAIEDGSITLTYAELDQRANQLAHYLRALGAGPNVPVGLCLPRSADMLVALLGILKSGAGVVPLDLSYPAERLSFMLEDAAVPLLVAKGVAPTACHARVVDLDCEQQAIARQPVSSPAAANGPEDLLYLLFTSGSTGVPNGALLPHRVIANLVAWQASQGFATPARTLQFTPISFDVSFQEIFTCWASGGALVVIDDERRRDPAALLGFLRDTRIERLFLPFVALQGLAAAALGQSDRELPSCLAQVITAGEQLRTTSALVGLFTRLGGCELHNHYGPTETHVVAAHRLPGAPSTWPSLPPIGRAISGAQLYVLDANLELVPQGVPGELFVGGVVVANGYLNRAKLAAERFTPNPLGGDGLLYRTGDLVRLRADGDYEFLGRNDAQIKIRGFRVDPAEIEAALTRHPSVAQATVVADDRQRLIAYVVATAGATVAAAALSNHIKGTLPPHMIPAEFVTLDALPLTASGKLNRRELPKPAFADAARPERQAPRTLAEQQLAEIWQEVLGVPSIGVHENFFDLGGHSLLAAQLVSRILRTFGVWLPLKKLFETSTIAEIAITLQSTAPAGPEAAIVPVRRQPQMPCSFAQERLWFASALEEAGTGYNMPGAFRLIGALDVAALGATLGEIVRRHEVLRTRLVQCDGRVMQIIEDGARPPLPLIELGPSAAGDARARQLIEELARHPFDLARDLPIRFTLLRQTATDHVLVVVMHHVAADGWSLGVLAREVRVLYAGYAAGKAAPLPDLPIQYADFAVWQRARLTDESCRPLREYWKKQLTGAPMRLDLPMAQPRPAMQSLRGATVAFTLGTEDTGRLRDVARHLGVTLYTVLLTAYAAMLYRLSGQDDFIIGAPTASRTRPEVESLIGFFVNVLPIRVRLSGQPTFAELALQLQGTVLDALAHEDLPFDKIVEDFAPTRTPTPQTPLSEVVFVLQNWPREPLELPGLTITAETYESFSAKHNLTLSIDETPAGLVGALEYATDLFDAAVARQMVDVYLRVAEAIIESADGQLLEPSVHIPPEHNEDFAFHEG
jgi:amino acid adenylation domain-containing protein